MRSAYFDYYFLDENCPYQLLALLEVAGLDLVLTSDFSQWEILGETVRVAIAANLVEEVRSRLACTTVLRARDAL